MKEAADWLQQHQITQVECIVPDMNGTAKGKLVLAEQILDTEIRIAEAIFGQDAIGQWCHDEALFQVADVDDGTIRWICADLVTHIVPGC